MQHGPADARGRLCQRSSAHRLATVRDHIRALDCDTIIPGHGPVTDQRGVEAVRSYLGYIRDQARKRYNTGLTARDAAHDIALGDCDSWGDAERVAVNALALYREFVGNPTPPNSAELVALMGEFWKKRRGSA